MIPVKAVNNQCESLSPPKIVFASLTVTAAFTVMFTLAPLVVKDASSSSLLVSNAPIKASLNDLKDFSFPFGVSFKDAICVSISVIAVFIASRLVSFFNASMEALIASTSLLLAKPFSSSFVSKALITSSVVIFSDLEVFNYFAPIQGRNFDLLSVLRRLVFFRSVIIDGFFANSACLTKRIAIICG